MDPYAILRLPYPEGLPLGCMGNVTRICRFSSLDGAVSEVARSLTRGAFEEIVDRFVGRFFRSSYKIKNML